MYRNNFNLGDENMDITLIFKVAGVGILISVLFCIIVVFALYFNEFFLRDKYKCPA